MEMEKIKILYYGGCWPTNIGNAFVNLGAVHLLRKATENRVQIFFWSGMSGYLFAIYKKSENTIPVSDLFRCDYLVIAGMTLCKHFFYTQKITLEGFINQGTKIIIAGGGAGVYNKEEVKEVRRWLKRIPVYALISRDTYSYNEYGDLAVYSYDGIDSAFFISDYFPKLEIEKKNFVIFTFDHMSEPKIKTEKEIIRLHHYCWPPAFKKAFFKYHNTLISDLPTDYLTLYANASVVYSDRVHACIVSLAYGNKAMFFSKKSPRIRMFERVGASDINKKPVQLNMEKLKLEKEKQISFLKKIL